MKNFERKLQRQPSQEICDDQFQIGINNLERAYSFNQAIENKENADQGNDSNNVRQRNQKIFGNSQEISCIDDDHESFQNLSDLVTDPLSSIKRQTLCDESVQKSKYDLHKIKSTVGDFQIHQTDLFELIKRNLQTLNILSFSQSLLQSTRQFVSEKHQNLSTFEQKMLISLKAQRYLINEIQSNNNIFINKDDQNQIKYFFLIEKMQEKV